MDITANFTVRGKKFKVTLGRRANTKRAHRIIFFFPSFVC